MSSDSIDLPAFIGEPEKESRRLFLKQLGTAAIAGFFPFSACRTTQNFPSGRIPELLNETEWLNLFAVQDILLPSAENSPGAREINAAAYLQWVISDTSLDPADTQFLKNGLTWLDEEAQKSFGQGFSLLNTEQANQLLREISGMGWGERWLSMMLLYLFEALLTDPVYGANPDGTGWKWLGHFPGLPRPDAKNRYKIS